MKKYDKSNKIAVEKDWMSKISQNLRKLGFSWKKQVGFRKRNCFFENTAETSKFGVKCDWNNPISQSVQNVVFLLEKYGFFERNCFA